MKTFPFLSRLLVAAALLCGGTFTSSLHAQPAAPSDSHDGHQHAAPAKEAGWVKGEVRRIDTDTNKLTLKHEAIVQFEMAPMTMVFRVASANLLQGLAVGDQVRFRLEKINQRVTVVDLQKLP